MAQVRVRLAANSWNKAFNKHPQIIPPQIDSRTKPVSVHCRIPVCIDYKEEIPEHILEAMIKDIEEKGFTYTVYLCPKDEQAYERWCQRNNQLFKKIPPEQIIHFTEWRTSSAWLNAENVYDQFVQGENKTEFENFLNTDITKWNKKYPHTSAFESESHILNSVKDILSWMAVKPIDNDSQIPNYTISLVMYAHSLSKSMQIALKYAHEMGFIKDSLIHIKYEIELISAEMFLSQLLTNISVKLGMQKVDCKWAAEFVAHLYNELGNKSFFSNGCGLGEK